MNNKRLSQDEFTMLRSLLSNTALFEGDPPVWRTSGRANWELNYDMTCRALDACASLCDRGLVRSEPARCCSEHAATHKVYWLTDEGRAFIERANRPTKPVQLIEVPAQPQSLPARLLAIAKALLARPAFRAEPIQRRP